MTYRKFPNRSAGRVGKTLGGALIRERAISPPSGFLQIENRTIVGWDMGKNVQKPSSPRAKKEGVAPLLENWRYIAPTFMLACNIKHDTQGNSLSQGGHLSQKSEVH